MQERQVTIGRETHPLPDPFLVMATQNPIESDGTYPLPEAQVDRFMLKVLVDYPTGTEEFVIVERMIVGLETVQSVHGRRRSSRRCRRRRRAVYVDPALIEYAVRVSSATRDLASVGLGDMAALRHLRRQPAGVDLHGPRRPGPGPGPRPRLRAARGRVLAWHPTCCATGWCSPTRRWATT